MVYALLVTFVVNVLLQFGVEIVPSIFFSGRTRVLQATPSADVLESQLTESEIVDNVQASNRSRKLLYIALGLDFEQCILPATGFPSGIWGRNKAGRTRVRSVWLTLFEKLCRLLAPRDELGLQDFFFEVIGKHVHGHMYQKAERTRF